MGLTYEQLDQILLGLEKKYPDNKLTHVVNEKALQHIKKAKEVSKLIRSLPLYLD